MGQRVARAALLIAVLTVASRVAGFVRVLVFNWAVGATDLGDMYQAANTIPNIVFEIVVGGALASLVIPLLAAARERDSERERAGRREPDGQRTGQAGDGSQEGQAGGAMLVWVITVLVPVAVLLAILAEPVIRMIKPEATGQQISAASGMLRVFAPQLPLYGLGIVLTGILQSHRRFAWPVLAPLLSSVAVSCAYLLFAGVAGRGVDIARVGGTGLMVLSVGTTLGVAVLTLSLLIPLRRLGLRLRPSYRLPAGTSGLARRFVGAGVATVIAQQLSLLVAISMAARGPDGSVVLYTLAQTIFMLPWAVLALPIATSVYPSLAEAGAAGDDEGFARVLAPAVRSVTLLSCLGAAVLLAVARPAAALLVPMISQAPPVGLVADAVAAFAPGLPGYAMFALLSRALYARGATRAAVIATLIGWGSLAAASVGACAVTDVRDRAAVLGTANSVGVTVLGAGLLIAVAVRVGPAALAGLGRAGFGALGGGVVAWGAGAAAVRLVAGSATPNVVSALGQGMLGASVAVAAYGAVVATVDFEDVRGVVAAVRRRAGGDGRAREQREAVS